MKSWEEGGQGAEDRPVDQQTLGSRRVPTTLRSGPEDPAPALVLTGQGRVTAPVFQNWLSEPKVKCFVNMPKFSSRLGCPPLQGGRS